MRSQREADLLDPAQVIVAEPDRRARDTRDLGAALGVDGQLGGERVQPVAAALQRGPRRRREALHVAEDFALRRRLVRKRGMGGNRPSILG